MEKILVAVSGRQNDRFVCEIAGFLALERSADICLLHIGEDEQVIRRAAAIIEKYTIEYKTKLLPSGQNIADTILKESKDYSILIVGSRSERSMEEKLLGSTAEKILRNASCRVIVAQERSK